MLRATNSGLPLATLLLPFALLGRFLGHPLQRQPPTKRVVRIIRAILIAGGIGLLRRGRSGR